MKRAFLAIAFASLFGWVCTYLATDIIKAYQGGLFVWLPFVMGGLVTYIFKYKNKVSNFNTRVVVFLSLVVYCLGLLAFAMEGAICLFMAFPIGLLVALLGYWVTLWLLEYENGNSSNFYVVIIMLSVPAFMGFEHITQGMQKNIRTVVTSVEIKAPIETVWENVISFPKLKEPSEFLFKTGIAYPTDATIEGQGEHAVRHCNFTTGTFVEPVTVWNKPYLLQFDVKEQPEPMREMSFYNIHPNHLHGYFVSVRGQFKLKSLSNGVTLLEGTTWYYDRIKPLWYWALWSDYIVHSIHKRVLTHIKGISESRLSKQ